MVFAQPWNYGTKCRWSNWPTRRCSQVDAAVAGSTYYLVAWCRGSTSLCHSCTFTWWACFICNGPLVLWRKCWSQWHWIRCKLPGRMEMSRARLAFKFQWCLIARESTISPNEFKASGRLPFEFNRTMRQFAIEKSFMKMKNHGEGTYLTFSTIDDHHTIKDFLNQKGKACSNYKIYLRLKW